MSVPKTGNPLGCIRRFAAQRLTAANGATLERMARVLRRDVLMMTAQAGSGHVGGAFSSLDILLLLACCADVTPKSAGDPAGDRIVVSHGHVSAALYACLGRAGFFPIEEAVARYRRAGSPFEGHPNSALPGVEWGSGALGQGLSAGCGFALASRMTRTPFHVYVVMGDGEQQKGQIAEARAFAAARGLSNLTAIVDCNRLQATGSVADVMPQRLAELYRAGGWEVLRARGHDFADLYLKLRACRSSANPTVILAETVMGKGVSFMENDYRYHGAVLSDAEMEKALAEIGEPDGGYSVPAETVRRTKRSVARPAETAAAPGARVVYPAGKMVDLRTAWGRAITDIV